MLRCNDNSIYTGITNDIKKRINAHLNKKGAKYTKSHIPIKLEILWETNNKSKASILEYQIKKLSKKQKELLIKTNNLKIINKIEYENYKRSNYDTTIFNRITK